MGRRDRPSTMAEMQSYRTKGPVHAAGFTATVEPYDCTFDGTVTPKNELEEAALEQLVRDGLATRVKPTKET